MGDDIAGKELQEAGREYESNLADALARQGQPGRTPETSYGMPLFSLTLILGGLTGFFLCVVCFVLAIVFGSGLWLGVSAGVLGISVGQFLAFILINE